FLAVPRSGRAQSLCVQGAARLGWAERRTRRHELLPVCCCRRSRERIHLIDEAADHRHEWRSWAVCGFAGFDREHREDKILARTTYCCRQVSEAPLLIWQ